MNGINRHKIDGMYARAQGKPSTKNPFKQGENGHDEWHEGWQCMNTQIVQLLTNAETIVKQIADIRSIGAVHV